MNLDNMKIRRASPEEMAMIISAHPPAGGAWSLLVLRSASEGGLLVAEEPTAADGAALGSIDRLGYLVLDNTSFFATGFVWLLFVNEEHRRRGVGSALMRRAGEICQTSDLFTSTHDSNAPMVALLTKMGWRTSGSIDNLNPDGQETLYHIDGHGERDNGRGKKPNKRKGKTSGSKPN